MSIFRKTETFIYKHLVVALQGEHTFDFVSDVYSKGKRVLDFGSGVGTNSGLFYPDDYVGAEVDASRVEESKYTFPNQNNISDTRADKMYITSVRHIRLH